jgi:hypothetical protein
LGNIFFVTFMFQIHFYSIFWPINSILCHKTVSFVNHFVHEFWHFSFECTCRGCTWVHCGLVSSAHLGSQGNLLAAWCMESIYPAQVFSNFFQCWFQYSLAHWIVLSQLSVKTKFIPFDDNCSVSLLQKGILGGTLHSGLVSPELSVVRLLRSRFFVVKRFGQQESKSFSIYGKGKS